VDLYLLLNYNGRVPSRVLYAAFDLVPSPKGASTHITYFVRGLVNAGYGTTLITAGDRMLPDRENYVGATLLRAPAGDEPHFLKRALAFGDFALAQAQHAPVYDFVHVRSIWSGWPLAKARPRLGYRWMIYEVNGLPSVELKYHYPAARETGVLSKVREWEVATLSAADAIICPARVTADFIASLGIDRDKITVIPNGVDTELFHPPVEDLPAPDVPTILYIGTYADWQGLEVLVRALPIVLAQRPVRLLLMGRGRKRQRKGLQKMARKLGVAEALAIEPAVPHEQVPAVISAADICVVPLGYNDRNVSQGCCPLKLLEYMACGRPVVAADLPVVREIARPGLEALLFCPDDPADLAGQILRLLSDRELASDLADRGAERVGQCFTWRQAQDRLLSVYNGLESGDPN